MPSNRDRNLFNICIWQTADKCHGCAVAGKLNCRFNWSDLAYFAAIFLPPATAAVAGMLIGGFGWFLLGWAAYALFFFFIWEARVLCSHCPFWAEDDKVLHCLANHGVLKIWRYHPEPMSTAEKVQFLLGAGIVVFYPLPFLIIGHQYIFAIIMLVSLVSFWFSLKKHVCSRCVNFSCPLNGVSKRNINEYLRRNPVMLKAWEKKGYRIDS